VAPRLTDPLGTTDALSALFSDSSVLQALLDVEVALARVQARLGLIPQSTAAAIGKVASRELRRRSRRSRREALRHDCRSIRRCADRVRARDRRRRRRVRALGRHQPGRRGHRVRAAGQIARSTQIDEDQKALAGALRALSDRHAGDVMLARTLLQPAPPITFGLKVAGWYAGVQRSWARVVTRRREALVIQLAAPPARWPRSTRKASTSPRRSRAS
jgi:3-carboxy-cis,cis-muconate cycloisomerase